MERQKAIRFRIRRADLDSTLSGFGDGIDNISDLNSQPRSCCGFRDADTVLEFVFGVRHYQEEVRQVKGKVDDLATWTSPTLSFLYPSKWTWVNPERRFFFNPEMIPEGEMYVLLASVRLFCSTSVRVLVICPRCSLLVRIKYFKVFCASNFRKIVECSQVAL